MAFKDHKQRIKRLSRDRDGDILGMPLYLFIIIIVTVISLAIVLAWLAMVDDPPMSIDVSASPLTVLIHDDGNGTYANDNFDITITVNDNNGNGVSGVLITLDGMDVKMKDGGRPMETTNSDGKVEFEELKILGREKRDGKITVTADWKDGASDTTTIKVRWK